MSEFFWIIYLAWFGSDLGIHITIRIFPMSCRGFKNTCCGLSLELKHGLTKYSCAVLTHMQKPTQSLLASLFFLSRMIVTLEDSILIILIIPFWSVWQFRTWSPASPVCIFVSEVHKYKGNMHPYSILGDISDFSVEHLPGTYYRNNKWVAGLMGLFAAKLCASIHHDGEVPHQCISTGICLLVEHSYSQCLALLLLSHSLYSFWRVPMWWPISFPPLRFW